MNRTVAVNDAGLRVGEGHHKAELTNHEVELIRQLHEIEGMGYGTLAKKFEQTKGTIAKICRYERRASLAARWKVIKTE